MSDYNNEQNERPGCFHFILGCIIISLASGLAKACVG